MNFATLVTRSSVFVAVAITAIGNFAYAGTIEIQLSGLNLNYSATTDDVVDSGGAARGNPSTANSDVLDAAVFKVDGVTQLPPLMTTDQYGDFFESLSATISDTTLGMPVSTGLTDQTGSGFGFEWFMLDNGVTEHFLDLEFDELRYVLIDTAFILTGTVSNLAGQDLPYGLAFDPNEEITLSYQSTNFSKMVSVNGGSVVETISASGQLTIAGTMAIPEPAAATMMLGSMLGFAGYLRHRWK